MTAILQVFGTFLLWLYKICGGSYALALIVFTLLTKVILFPLSYKGKKGMMQMNTMQAEMARLQKQYGNNRVKYNEEVQKLYEREGVNPMSGCLWSFLPLPILMALYYVIRRPMLYMMHLTTEQITAAITAVEKLGKYTLSGSEIYQEMQVAGLMYGHQDVLSAVQTAVGDGASKLEIINFNFLGLDLSQIPKLKFWENGVSWASIGLFLIPIIVTVLNVGYSRLSQKTNNFNKNQKGSGNEAMDRTNKMMLFVMPLMYLWFGYIMPAGMCVYMAFNAIFMAVQDSSAPACSEASTRKWKRLARSGWRKKRKRNVSARQRSLPVVRRRKRNGKRTVGRRKRTSPKRIPLPRRVGWGCVPTPAAVPMTPTATP